MLFFDIDVETTCYYTIKLLKITLLPQPSKAQLIPFIESNTKIISISILSLKKKCRSSARKVPTTDLAA